MYKTARFDLSGERTLDFESSNLDTGRLKSVLSVRNKTNPKQKLGRGQHLPYPYLKGRDITSGLNTLKRHEWL